jgi:hypothetical protein
MINENDNIPYEETEEYIYEGSFKNNKFDGYGIL